MAEQIEGLVGLALAVLITRITNVLARLIWRQEYLDSGAIAIQSQQHRHGDPTKAIHINETVGVRKNASSWGYGRERCARICAAQS